jgi:DNA polymerase-3 subunit epsilon
MFATRMAHRGNETPIGQRARELLASGQFVVLDTETTGLGHDAEPVEIVAIAADGSSVVSTLIRPAAPIPWGAMRVHGISNAMVTRAPTLPQFWPELCARLAGQHILAYNASFDQRILAQAAQRYGLTMFPATWGCLMRGYQQYARLSRWVSLEKACHAQNVIIPPTHRAHADALATLALLRAIAGHDS